METCGPNWPGSPKKGQRASVYVEACKLSKCAVINKTESYSAHSIALPDWHLASVSMGTNKYSLYYN